jgi:predicted alpha/beta hydrolase family esterase
MKIRIILVHGWGGSSRNDWFPWMKKSLGKLGFFVEIPDMPDTDNPKIERWVPYLQKIIGEYDKNTYLLGHSIGCQTILRCLEQKSDGKKIGGAVFVAPWLNLDGLESDEERFISSPWVTVPIDFEKVKAHCQKFVCIFSDDDPFVSKDNWKVFSKELDSENLIKSHKGHFTADDGIVELPEALDAVMNIAGIEK